MSTNNPANIPDDIIASLPDSLRAQIPYYYETRQPNLYTAATVCFAAVWIVVGLRLYSRRLKCQNLAWDDYMMLISLGLHIPFYISFILTVYFGSGRHLVVTILEHPQYDEPRAKAGVATAALYLVPLYFTKVSHTPCWVVCTITLGY